MPALAAIEVLFREYATGSKEAVAARIGGTVGANILNPAYKAYKDTCAIRVSRSLNYSGSPIPWAGGGIEGVRTDKGGDNKYYIYSTYDIRKYLNNAFGQAKSFEGNITKKKCSGNKRHYSLWLPAHRSLGRIAVCRDGKGRLFWRGKYRQGRHPYLADSRPFRHA